MAPDAPTPDPNPGSDEARELGCRCPVLDNAHGRGAWGTSGDDAVFWTSETCPLHGPCPACNDSGVLSTMGGDTIGPCPECAP